MGRMVTCKLSYTANGWLKKLLAILLNANIKNDVA